jgi:ribosomal protein S18 acetylase RimI-like enzyme
MPWSVRRARPGDAEAWHALQRTIYAEGRAFVGDGAPSAGALAARLRALEPDEGVVVFAVADGRPIAWAEAYRLGSRRLAHVAMLTIAVADGWRGRGVGAELMAALEAWARRARVRKLQLHVRAGNHAAIALYRRLGYVVEGVLAEQVAADGGFEDEWVMARSLTAGAG